MVCDALWVGVVKREKHDLYCPKCGYERTEADGSTPRTDCPRCGVIYAKVLPTKTLLEQQKISSPSIASTSVEQQIAQPSPSLFQRYMQLGNLTKGIIFSSMLMLIIYIVKGGTHTGIASIDNATKFRNSSVPTCQKYYSQLVMSKSDHSAALNQSTEERIASDEYQQTKIAQEKGECTENGADTSTEQTNKVDEGTLALEQQTNKADDGAMAHELPAGMLEEIMWLTGGVNKLTDILVSRELSDMKILISVINDRSMQYDCTRKAKEHLLEMCMATSKTEVFQRAVDDFNNSIRNCDI